MPNTAITADPNYNIIDERTIEIKGARYTKCTEDTNPELDYSTMKDSPTPPIENLDFTVGLPDYEKSSPFTNQDREATATLRQTIESIKRTSRECVSGSVPVWKDWNVKLYSNVCDQGVLRKLRRLIGVLAPTLHQRRLSFWLTSLDTTGTPTLLVGHLDLSTELVAPYPFLSLWRIKIEGDSYSARHAGPFLNGKIHAVREFGDRMGRHVVFVRHLSCIECEATVYLTPIDFDADTDARPYEFTYSEKHDSFSATLEYALPGMGHTVDATVETRLLPPSVAGPHLLQFFHMLEQGNPDEWWAFTCKQYRCDYKLEKASASPEFLRLWALARKL